MVTVPKYIPINPDESLAYAGKDGKVSGLGRAVAMPIGAHGRDANYPCHHPGKPLVYWNRVGKFLHYFAH